MIVKSEVISISLQNNQTLREGLDWDKTDANQLVNFLSEAVALRPDLIVDEFGAYGGGYFAEQVARMRNLYEDAGVDPISEPQLPAPYSFVQRDIISQLQKLIRQLQVVEYLCILSTVCDGFELGEERWRIVTSKSVVECTAQELYDMAQETRI